MLLHSFHGGNTHGRGGISQTQQISRQIHAYSLDDLGIILIFRKQAACGRLQKAAKKLAEMCIRDRLYIGGKILTMEKEEYAEALLVENGKIKAVGTQEELEAMGRGAECIRLHGAVAVSYTHLDVYKRQE